MSRPAPFQLRGVQAWDALVKTVERAFSEAAWPEAGRDVVLQFENGSLNALGAQRTLRARVRFTRRREPQAIEEFCVLFLEDVRNMQARSRQEKLAAMGRVSAGIAHEIRNPLAAISQANALLSEDATDPAQRQLMRMVSDNVERLKRIVDDVMEVAPGVVPDVGVIDATAQVIAVCGEWAKANGVALGEKSLLQIELPKEPVGVLFDAEHLRRVLVNLLDNAYRHASRTPGAIQLRLDSRHEAQAFLSLASDGAPIPPDVEPYLFEPFFSTRSRGTGLGLYICRELCERYGATIDYRLRAPGLGQRNEFFVDMQRKALGPNLSA
jgi:two-component system sensor histidine kinase PilS (NtrC family)